MTTLPSARNAILVALVEMRRSWRKLRANPGRLALLALAMVFPALIVVAAPFGAYFLGRTLRGGGLSIPLRPIRGFATFFVLLGVVGNCYRVLQQSGDLDEREGLLTTIPARDAAAGVLLAELAPRPPHLDARDEDRVPSRGKRRHDRASADRR